MISSLRIARRVIAGGALTCIAALASACSSGSQPPAPVTTVTVTPTTQASVAATPATSAAAPPASQAPAGPPPCPTRSLQAKVGIGQGTAGSTYTVIDFTNISNVTCTLYGYPGVSLAGGQPITQIGLAAAENPATPRQLVTLAPGAVANALLRIVHAGNYPASKCGPVTATWLQIYPPNQTTPIYLKYSSPTCSRHVQILTINVVLPGSGG
jgi:uncharacterized protein DUF4232